jgi:hypothetical protein
VKLEIDVVELPNCAAVTVVVKAQIAMSSNNNIATGNTTGFDDCWKAEKLAAANWLPSVYQSLHC